MASNGSSGASISRRGLLIGGIAAIALGSAAVVGIENDIIPGRSSLYRLLGLDGPAGVIPKIAPGPMLTGSFTSLARLGKKVNWAVSYPPGTASGSALPVLIVLHGNGGNHRSAFGNDLGLDRFLAQCVAAGHPPFAIASIDGGNTYWHKRASGEDAGAMVMDEFPLVLADRGLDISRKGLLGWSMGGYGALHLGGLGGSKEYRTAIAESPAIWPTATAALPGAFDGPANFAANTVFGRQRQLDNVAVLVDCGIGDGFYPNTRDYVAKFVKRPAGGFITGGHDTNYWRRVAPAQLAFAAEHLQ